MVRRVVDTEDMIGKTFNRVTITGIRGRENRCIILDYICECGTRKFASKQDILTGKVKSCGCWKLEESSNRMRSNLIGRRFGKLVVVSYAGLNNHQKTMWHCKCDCGNEKDVIGAHMVNGNISSCGCLRRELSARNATKHGLRYTPEYIRATSRKRREKKAIYDCEWSAEHEISISEFFKECVLCGSQDQLATDHVYPLDLGYGLAPGNAVRLCIHCNSSKRNRMPNDLPKTLPKTYGAVLVECAKNFKGYWEKTHAER